MNIRSEVLSWQWIVLYFIFCLAIYFSVFMHLETMPITVWDESLFALRAHYMEMYGAYMPDFNVFDGMQTHRNTKLPFTTFFQVLGIKLFGLNELGIRLPIAFIFVFFIFYWCYFTFKNYGSSLSGVIAGFVLIGSTGFVAPHMLRTGDQDVPFAIYLFLCTLFFHRYTLKRKSTALILSTFFFIAALLTKNLLAGLILPGFILFLLFKKKFISVFSDYRVYIAIFSVIATYMSTVLYLNYQYPGFISRMWNYELMGRYTDTIEQHSGSFFFYFNRLFEEDMNPFMYLFPFTFLVYFVKSADKRILSFISLNGCVFLSYSLIISFSQTKTAWYHAPLFILVAVNIGLASSVIFKKLKKSQIKMLKPLLITLLVIVYAVPYSNVISNVFHPDAMGKDSKYGNFIPAILDKNKGLNTFTIVDNNFGTSAVFYKEMYNRKGYNISFQKEIDFQNNEMIVTCLNNVLNPLKQKYEYTTIEDHGDCKLIRIDNKSD